MTKISGYNQRLMQRRHFLTASLLLTVTFVDGCATPTAPRPLKVLFVCQYGTAKSAIAREVFRQRAKRRGMTVEAFSRGITLEDHISAGLLKNLRSDGIDSTFDPAQVLASKDLQAADILVKFNVLPTSVEHPDIRDWMDVPSVNDDYANARKVMNERIDALLDEIAGKVGSR
jgi:protein-tyrosine-phosphatase